MIHKLTFQNPPRFLTSFLFLMALAGAMCLSPLALTVDTAHAQSAAVGKSGLPLPRFVSLKSKRVNMRVGPGQDYQVVWMYLKRGLPMEIIQEFDNWRKVRDPEGNEGWILHSLLSGKRTAIIAPWDGEAKDKRVSLYENPDDTSPIAAEIEPGVVTSVGECTDNWCRLQIASYEGYVKKNALWGVYPDELIDD